MAASANVRPGLTVVRLPATVAVCAASAAAKRLTAPAQPKRAEPTSGAQRGGSGCCLGATDDAVGGGLGGRCGVQQLA